MSSVHPGHNASDIKSLDAIRLRLQQLVTTLASLRRDIEISDPLPPWSTILTTSHLLNHHVSALTSYLSTTFNTHSDSTISNFTLGGQPHAYPLPSFPFGPDYENILLQLLRKKLDPAVEDWIESSDAAAASAFSTNTISAAETTNGATSHTFQLNPEEQEELWEWANPRAGDIAGGIPWGIDYTMAERDAGAESVVTGLNRELDDGMETEDDEDDEDDDDEKNDGEDKVMKGADGSGKKYNPQPPPSHVVEKPMIPLDDVLRFMSTGALPRIGNTTTGGMRPGVAPR